MTPFRNYCLLVLFYLPISCLYGQYKITPAEGYSPQVGIMVDMLEDLKDRITARVEQLDQEQTDFLIDDKANSIGAMIMHLAATEVYYQVETLEGRRMTKEEADFWAHGSNLGADGRAHLKGKPISYYLDLWDEVRSKTLAGLREKDDAWFAAEADEGMNNHWVWFHVMEHQANHMGQIALVMNRLR